MRIVIDTDEPVSSLDATILQHVLDESGWLTGNDVPDDDAEPGPATNTTQESTGATQAAAEDRRG